MVSLRHALPHEVRNPAQPTGLFGQQEAAGLMWHVETVDTRLSPVDQAASFPGFGVLPQAALYVPAPPAGESTRACRRQLVLEISVYISIQCHSV